MFENREYNRPSKIEFEGILIKNKNKRPFVDEKFLNWCSENSKNFDSYNKMAEQLGLDGRCFKRIILEKGIELEFSPFSKTTPKLYQNKEWLKHQKIDLCKTNKQIAEEFGWTERVIEKWVQLFGFGSDNFKFLKNLSPIQEELIEASILGDGHISEELIFIVSHSIKQKDYLFWKYEILKDLCKTPPSFYKEGVGECRGKSFKKNESYRFGTRKIKAFKSIKEKQKIEIIKNINEFKLSIWLLDDGSRSKYNWELCFAALTEEEKIATINKLKNFGIESKMEKDNRYLWFPAESSKKIDKIILKSIPNSLDIIQYKIINKRR